MDPLTVRRLGLFGGTFDPVHEGHLHVARTARAARGLDAVLFVPAARSPHKAEPAEATDADRLAMLELALAGEPAFAVSSLELERGAPSYTIDTVRELARLRADVEGGELFLLLGSDNLRGLGTWREVEALLALTTPLVVARRLDEPLAPEALAELSEPARARLRAGSLEAETVDVAATELREALARGERIDELPRAVGEYIAERGIYRTS